MNPVKTVKITEDNIFTVLGIGNWLLLAVMTLSGLIFGSYRFAVSVMTGGILAIGNFYWLMSIMKRVLALPVTEAGRFAQVRYILRLAIMGFVVWALIAHVGIDVIGLIVGLSVLVINIIALAIYKVTLKGG